MGKKHKQEVKSEVVEVVAKVNPLAVRYITICKERGLNGLDTSKLTDAQLDAIIKHLTR